MTCKSVLLLYSTDDLSATDDIKEALENSAHCNTFYARRDLVPSKTPLTFIDEALTVCQKIVVTLSDDFLSNRQCCFDIEHILDHTRCDGRAEIILVSQDSYDELKSHNEKCNVISWLKGCQWVKMRNENWRHDLVHKVTGGRNQILCRNVLKEKFLSEPPAPGYQRKISKLSSDGCVSLCELEITLTCKDADNSPDSVYSIQALKLTDDMKVLPANQRFCHPCFTKVKPLIYINIQRLGEQRKATPLNAEIMVQNKAFQEGLPTVVQHESSLCLFGGKHWQDVTSDACMSKNHNDGFFSFVVKEPGTHAICTVDTNFFMSNLEKDLVSDALAEFSGHLGNSFRLCLVQWESSYTERQQINIRFSILSSVATSLEDELNFQHRNEIVLGTTHTVIYGTIRIWHGDSQSEILCVPIEFRLHEERPHEINLVENGHSWHGRVDYFEDCHCQIWIGKMIFGKISHSDLDFKKENCQSKVKKAGQCILDQTLHIKIPDESTKPKPPTQVTPRSEFGSQKWKSFWLSQLEMDILTREGEAHAEFAVKASRSLSPSASMPELSSRHISFGWIRKKWSSFKSRFVLRAFNRGIERRLSEDTISTTHAQSCSRSKQKPLKRNLNQNDHQRLDDRGSFKRDRKYCCPKHCPFEI